MSTQIGIKGGLPSWVETNATDLTIWSNGKGNNVTNTSYGDGALRINTTGSVNTAIGYNALFNSTTAASNTAIGHTSMYTTTTGDNNSALGDASLLFNTTGFNNTAIGVNALSSNTTGNNNVAIGLSSGGASTTGSLNTAIGSQTVIGNFSSCIILGYQATATANNQFVVGTASTPSGTVTTETTVSSSKTWSVKINGVVQKILLV